MASRLYLPATQLSGATVVVEGEAHHHLRVLRLGPGDEVLIFDGEGTEIAARITEAGPRSATLALGARRTLPLPPCRITLWQGVAKGERMDLVVQKTTELGVARIVPVLTSRSVAEGRSEARLQRWRTIAQEAARQCGRADLPVIEAPRPLGDQLAEPASSDERRFVLWEQSSGRSLGRALSADAPAVTLLVGPEGGLSTEEVAAARAGSFEAVGLGPRILRAETAAIVAVALAQATTGGLD